MSLIDVKLDELEEKLGYSFKNRELLYRALTHTSYAFEKKDVTENYEVLEFLGDSVIGLIVSEKLVERFPEKSEGELSQIRAFLVSEPSLAKLARSVDLGKFIFLGKGEIKSGGKEKDSILCDVFESIFGAIYLDSNFETAKKIFENKFIDEMWQILEKTRTYKDYKSYLQEITQRDFKTIPQYRVIKEEGPEHSKEFTVECWVNDYVSVASGKSKKEAEQLAAEKMLEKLGIL
ncbi:ribonuclease III [Desulfurobacterium atlanticum]|uniref:Ribonuclease 3 n=1 Tax=Desulfurobacterium atlanticum TaxID=240169 RepID=A0A238XUC1_9BACT|nr:ribonuclease III [Desulfurobacterium atlanticum]SNR62101.1 ribonuclease-3 [Desulfurobacterium atlanticum]